MTPTPTTLDEARAVLPPMWVVYDNPADFPGEWVARVWYGEVASAEVLRAPDLVTLRELIVIAGGSVRLHRNDADDAVIRETWL